MKISELSRQTGTPLATIKYYQREGLLPPGALRGTNQADYGEAHAKRLVLIRTLREVGGMGIQAIRQVVGVLDAPETTTLDALGTAVDALSPPESAPETAIDATEQAEWWRAEVDIDAFLRTRGWCVRPEAASRRGLIDGLVALRRVHGPDVPALAFATYADLIHGLATQEIDSVRAELQGNTSTAIEAVVIGTVMWEPVLLALRRLAHEALSRELLASF